MSYAGARNWPPPWTSLRDKIDKLGRAEVGILKEVKSSELAPERLILIMEHGRDIYGACLMFDDASFCKQLCDWMKGRVGWTIKDIGDADLSHTL